MKGFSQASRHAVLTRVNYFWISHLAQNVRIQILILQLDMKACFSSTFTSIYIWNMWEWRQKIYLKCILSRVPGDILSYKYNLAIFLRIRQNIRIPVTSVEKIREGGNGEKKKGKRARKIYFFLKSSNYQITRLRLGFCLISKQDFHEWAPFETSFKVLRYEDES